MRGEIYQSVHPGRGEPFLGWGSERSLICPEQFLCQVLLYTMALKRTKGEELLRISLFIGTYTVCTKIFLRFTILGCLESSQEDTEVPYADDTHSSLITSNSG